MSPCRWKVLLFFLGLRALNYFHRIFLCGSPWRIELHPGLFVRHFMILWRQYLINDGFQLIGGAPLEIWRRLIGTSPWLLFPEQGLITWSIPVDMQGPFVFECFLIRKANQLLFRLFYISHSLSMLLTPPIRLLRLIFLLLLDDGWSSSSVIWRLF